MAYTYILYIYTLHIQPELNGVPHLQVIMDGVSH